MSAEDEKADEKKGITYHMTSSEDKNSSCLYVYNLGATLDPACVSTAVDFACPEGAMYEESTDCCNTVDCEFEQEVAASCFQDVRTDNQRAFSLTWR